MTWNHQKKIREAILLVMLSLGALITVVPFIYMISTALKGPVYVFEIPPRIIPEHPTIQNFISAWTANQFSRYFMNSIFVTAVTVLTILLLASMMAYAFARYEFFGKKFLYGIVIFFMTMPAMSLIVPQFVLARPAGVDGQPDRFDCAVCGAKSAFRCFSTEPVFGRDPQGNRRSRFDGRRFTMDNLPADHTAIMQTSPGYSSHLRFPGSLGRVCVGVDHYQYT